MSTTIAPWQNPRARAQAAAVLELRRRASAPRVAPSPYADWYASTLPPAWRRADGSLPRHIEYLCARIQDLVDGRVQRLAISTPPGHAKSETVTRRLPNYWSLLYPGDVVLQTGYSQRFAEKHLSYPTRELAREAGTLAPSATALDEWEWTNGTRLVTRGVGNAPVGVNPISLLVADDPINSREDAASAVMRENLWAWWTGSIVQRFWPRTRAVVIATRWHEDDLIGRLKAQEAALPEDLRTWTFVNLPALSMGPDADPLGRPEGEALWPEAKPAAFLEGLRREMGAYEFEALFQGNPTPREGSIFKVDKLKFCEPADVPPLARACRAYDLAATAGAGDYTVGAKLGRAADGTTYVLDLMRGQWEASDRNAKLRAAAAADGPSVTVRLPQDPGQAGKEQAGALTRMLSGVPVKALPVSGDKQTRADPFAAQVNAGNVVVVRAHWNDAFREELRAFPAGTHDDIVDACADAFNELAILAGDPFNF